MNFDVGLWSAIFIISHHNAQRNTFPVKIHKSMFSKRIIDGALIGGLMMAIGVLAGCQAPENDLAALPFYRTAEMTPEWIAETDDAYDAIHQVKDFSFINQGGAEITAQAFDGKIYVANFFFVHCSGICPTMRTNLAKIQQAFLEDDEVLLLSHTVQPETDTVPVLQHYATVNDVVPGKWHLVTGTREAIYTLARDSYFADLEADLAEDGFLHTENFILVDKDRRIRGVYNGTLAFDVQRLIEDIAVLKQAS